MTARAISTPSEVIDAVAPLAPRCAELVAALRKGVPRGLDYWIARSAALQLYVDLSGSRPHGEPAGAEEWAVGALLNVDGSHPALDGACECARRAVATAAKGGAACSRARGERTMDEQVNSGGAP